MFSSVSISLTNPVWKLVIARGEGKIVKHDPKQGPEPRLCVFAVIIHLLEFKLR
jgi:hypothetical protein